MPLAFKDTELKNNYSLSSIRFQDLLITCYMNSINQCIQILLSRSTLHFKCKFIFFPFVSLYCCNRFHLILYIHGIFGNWNSMLDLVRWLRTYKPWKIFVEPFIRGPSMFYKLSQPILILFVRPFYIMLKVRYLLSRVAALTNAYSHYVMV